MTALRKKAREVGVQVRVIRNTLAKRAFEGTDFECMKEALLGPTIVAFSLEDPGAGARVFKDFAKENKDFEIKALSVGGKLLPATQIDALALFCILSVRNALSSTDNSGDNELISALTSVASSPVTYLIKW